MGQDNGSFRTLDVDEVYADSDLEYLRQWLLRNGATEMDGCVFLSICW